MRCGSLKDSNSWVLIFASRELWSSGILLGNNSTLVICLAPAYILLISFQCRAEFNGTPTKPRLSVFCSDKQLYAVLVDDQNKKCLFYASTLQKSIRENPPCSKIEAAERVGNELVKTCIELNINEISQYDCNGFARGERMQAFETAIAQHGFLLC
ncbi:hypothetical protein RHGRI_033689 [Rhododendron griersonianum]|uniref:Ribosomal protein L18 n=1 Tax=Rhododendron griersonianum TaxID=479676 RepID=A0AAV6HXR5_9ERIC|nr:hypothetical protein RHGRI_033689 [Rhododendron griersonianum]